MAVSIVEGQPSNVATLHDLVAVSREAGAEAEVTSTAESMQSAFTAGAFQFLLAHVEGEVAGMAVYHQAWDECRCAVELRLENVFVSPGFRRQGVGEQLVRAAWQRAEDSGSGNMRFQIPRDSEAAASLYQKLGARLRGDILNFELCGDALDRAAAPSWPNELGVRIRSAEPADARHVTSLLRHLARFEGELDSYEDAPPPLGAEASGLQLRFLLAEAPPSEEAISGRGRVLGLAVVLPGFSSCCGCYAELQCLIVHESVRRKGIGSQLMGAACREVAAMGVRRLAWRSFRWNAVALAFSERRLSAGVDADGERVAGSLPSLDTAQYCYSRSMD